MLHPVCIHKKIPNSCLKALKKSLSLLVVLSMVAGIGTSAFAAVSAKYDKTGSNEKKIVENKNDKKPKYVKDEVIVKFKSGSIGSKKISLSSKTGLTVKKNIKGTGAELYKIKNGSNVEKIVKDLTASGEVQFAQPNYCYYPDSVELSDERWSDLWGLNNTENDVDIDAPEAWDYTNNLNETVVAVIDTGCFINHPDLEGKIWTNPDEIPDNGIDDDGNGYIDDIHGWDFYNNDNTLAHQDIAADEDFHGTHVAGTISAAANDIGVVGVAPNVKIMPLKFLGADGGTTLGAVEAIKYAKSKGVRISNNSWGGAGTPLDDYILKQTIADSGMLFVAAAGNDSSDNDGYQSVPSGFNLDNILSVAAVNNQGELAWFSNYGAETVDVGAPGEHILSTIGSLPDIASAAVQNSVYNEVYSYKTMTCGFRMEELAEPDMANAMEKVMKDYFDIEPGEESSILLVNDGDCQLQVDGEYINQDCTESYIEALEGAGFTEDSGTTIRTYNVGIADLDGPDSVQMAAYDAVVWFFGDSSGIVSFDEEYNATLENVLKENDRNNINSYLQGSHGNLLLTGDYFAFTSYNNDDEQWIDSDFARQTLGINIGDLIVSREESYDRISGAEDSVFEGDNYNISNYFYTDFSDVPQAFNYILTPSEELETSRGVMTYLGSNAAYDYYDGTSMATPHVTGVAAALMGQKNVTIQEVKEFLMSAGKALPSLEGMTVSGKMVDLAGVIATQTVNSEVSLSSNSVGENINLSIDFTTGQYGKLVAGKEIPDTINIVFPETMVLPESVSANLIYVNDNVAGEADQELSFSGNTLSIPVPIDIESNEDVTVSINTGAGIANPDSVGNIAIGISTSVDPVTVFEEQEIIEDSQAPSWPEGSSLTASDIKSSSIVLNWTPGEDNYRVKKYDIYVNGDNLYSVQGDVYSFKVNSLYSNTLYNFKVEAVDFAKNSTSNGPLVSAKTLSSSGGGSGGSGGVSDSSSGATGQTNNNSGQISSSYAAVPQITDGTANAEVTKEGSAQILKQADEIISLINKNGNKEKSEIVIDIPSQTGIQEINAKLPSDLVKGLADKGIDKLNISTGIASLEFSPADIKTEANGNISITAAIVDPKNLTEGQKALVNNNQVYDFNVKLLKTDGTQQIINQFANSVKAAIPYTLGAGENPDNITVFYLNDNGQLENMVGRYDSELKSVVFITDHFSKYVIKQNAATFKDVNADNWAKKYIEVMAAKGIVKGMENGEFEPDGTVTRAEFSAMLVRALSVPKSTACISCRFKDGDKTAWYAKDVMTAVRAGLVTGYEDRTVRADNLITREEMAVIAARAAKIFRNREAPKDYELSFSDSEMIKDFAKESVALSVKNEIMNGRNKGEFDPEGYTTRAEAAKIIYMIYNMK